MAALIASTCVGGTSSGTVTSGSQNTTGANLIVIAAVSYHLGGATTISDNKSNTWTALTERSSTGVRDRLYYCLTPTVGTGHTFTSAGTGIYPTIGVCAFSGASAYDQESGASASSGTSIQPGSITPSTANNILVTGANDYTSSALAIGGGFTASVVAYVSGQHLAGGIAYLIQTTATAANPTWSWTGSVNNAAAMACFKAGGLLQHPGMAGRMQSMNGGINA